MLKTIAVKSSAAALICSISLAAYAMADVERQINVPAGDLLPALQSLAKQTDVELVYQTSVLKGLHTRGVSGQLSAQDAVKKLLEGTPLQVGTDASTGAMVISPPPAAAPAKPIDTSSKEPRSDEAKGDQKRSFWDRFRLAQVDQRASVSDSTSSERAGTAPSVVEEVIVTAQKRAEPLLEVPVPVTSISAESLTNSNQLRLQDYYTKVPGLNLSVLGDANGPSISIRGVTTGGYVTSTTGIVVDDIPFGASVFSGFGGSPVTTPDFDPSELERVEVLRGPQGTLYGASSMGGLVKFVTVDPSTDHVSGRMQLGTSTVEKSSEVGYSVRGVLNVPLSDTFAVRASGSTRRDPGYVDNVQTGQNDINRIDSDSARLAALWKPSDLFSLKLSALYQKSDRDGSSEVSLPGPAGPQTATSSGRPDLGDLDQSALIGSGTFSQQLQAYSAIATAHFGSAELVSLSGYNKSRILSSMDGSPVYGVPYALPYFGVTGFVQDTSTEVSKFSQELRLSMPLSERIDWLFGAFYVHEHYPGGVDLLAINPTNGAVAGNFYHGVSTGSYREYAAFTDFTFTLTDRFDVQVGARDSHNDIDYSSSVVAHAPFAPSVTPQSTSSDNAFTYLLTPRFRISQDFMLYARFASGYRPGGPNLFPVGTTIGVPLEYGHDTTETYEIGAKGTLFDRLLTFDASVYDIDWKKVQLQLRDQLPSGIFQTYTLNAGKARSKGVELSLELKPLTGLSLSASGAYNDATLTDVPTDAVITARAGDRLPYSARVSGNLSAQQELRVGAETTLFFGGSWSYVGDRRGRFFTGFAQETFPSYTQLDLRAGATYGTWTLNAYANNVADKRGILRAGRDSNLSIRYSVQYIEPRMAGFSVTKTFD